MKAINLFPSIEAAAAAEAAAEMSAQDVVLYLAARTMLPPMPDLKTCKDLETWKATAAAYKAPKDLVAEYRVARGIMAARKIGGAAGVKSYMMDTETWTNLPEGPMKQYRVRALGAGRQALLDLRARQHDMVRKMYASAATKGKDGKALHHAEVKDPLTTFEDFKKALTSRNQRREDINAGEMSAVIAKMRELLVAALLQKK